MWSGVRGSDRLAALVSRPISEGDAVELRGRDGRVIDQGSVVSVAADRSWALVRWTAPGGLRAPQRVDLEACDVRRVEVQP